LTLALVLAGCSGGEEGACPANPPFGEDCGSPGQICSYAPPCGGTTCECSASGGRFVCVERTDCGQDVSPDADDGDTSDDATLDDLPTTSDTSSNDPGEDAPEPFDVPQADVPHDTPPDECSPDCQGRICGSDGCGGMCGACDRDEECASDGTTCEQRTGVRITSCFAWDTHVGEPLEVSCGAYDAWGGPATSQMVSSDFPEATLQDGVIRTDFDLAPEHIGLYHFELVAEDSNGNVSSTFPVTVPVERYKVTLTVPHNDGLTSQTSCPQALYDLLGTECQFSHYTPIAELGLEPGHTTPISVSAATEPAAVECMTDLILSLPVEHPNVWEYTRFYGQWNELIFDAIYDVAGYTFYPTNHYVEAK